MVEDLETVEVLEGTEGLESEVLKDSTLCKFNYKNKMDGVDLLKNLKDNTVKIAFFDPQYRGVLDKLSYGNEGKARGKARCDLTQMTEEKILEFIKEYDRVVKPSGYLFLWVDKFHVCTGVLPWFDGTKFNLVDMITWDKDKIGMGYRTRRKCEYLIVLQKEPVKAKATWTIHNIPDVWTEKVVKVHAHSKPEGLQKELIKATTEVGDLVCDAASGGYSVFRCCQELDRVFIGGDIQFGE